MSLNNAYVRTLAPEELLDGGRSAQVWDRADFSRAVRSNRRGEAGWRLAPAATVYGFATWWTAELVPGVTLSTGPSAPRTHWEQLYFPLLRPMAADAGETVRVSLRSRSSREGARISPGRRHGSTAREGSSNARRSTSTRASCLERKAYEAARVWNAPMGWPGRSRSASRAASTRPPR